MQHSQSLQHPSSDLFNLRPGQALVVGLSQELAVQMTEDDGWGICRILWKDLIQQGT